MADTTTYLSVSQAQSIFNENQDTIVNVKGYIVGCVEGTVLKKANFTAPFGVESNILLADDSVVTNTNRCMPIRLLIHTDYRTQLNLIGHPELYRKHIVIRGKLEKYFTVCGIRTIIAYSWLQENTSANSDRI